MSHLPTFCARLRSIVSEHASWLGEGVEGKPLDNGALRHTSQTKCTGPEREGGAGRGEEGEGREV